jgi:hypothetical protein
MLGGRDLAGGALDQGPQDFAGEPTDLDAKELGLRVDLQTSRRGLRPPRQILKQAAWRTVMDVAPRLSGHLSALVSPIQITLITE